MKTIILVTLFVLSGLVPSALAQTNGKETPKNPTEPKYVITSFTVVPSKGTLPPEYFYTIEFGNTVLRVKYTDSQTTTAKPGDFPGSGLHMHNALYNPDLSQVPNAGVPVRACTFNKARDHDGDLIIAHQSTDEPCMARIGDKLHFEPSPNGPALFTYVGFDILSEKTKH
jgi:hypothetical protein